MLVQGYSPLSFLLLSGIIKTAGLILSGSSEGMQRRTQSQPVKASPGLQRYDAPAQVLWGIRIAQQGSNT
jgi:hypothetical protein